MGDVCSRILSREQITARMNIPETSQLQTASRRFRMAGEADQMLLVSDPFFTGCGSKVADAWSQTKLQKHTS